MSLYDQDFYQCRLPILQNNLMFNRYFHHAYLPLQSCRLVPYRITYEKPLFMAGGPMIKIESIPENLSSLRDAVVTWLTDQQDQDIPDEFKSTLKGFAASYGVDLNNMTHDDMVLLDHRIEHWDG